MRNKKILAIGVLIVGIVCATYILLQNSKTQASSINIVGSDRQSNNFFNPSIKIDASNLTDPTYNVTDEVAKEYTKQIIKMNEGGQGGTTNINLPDADKFESIVKTYLSQTIQFKEYAEKDLRLLDDDSIQARRAYLEQLKKIQNTQIDQLQTSFVYAAALFINQRTSDALQKHVTIYDQYITELLELKIPKSAASFQINLLNIYEKRRTLGNILLENSDDPMKDVLVLQEIEKLTNQEVNLTNSFRSILQ